ncbi:hypothetical protein V8C44DRAFT_327131 [Trichoderma aethiopicum]
MLRQPKTQASDGRLMPAGTGKEVIVLTHISRLHITLLPPWFPFGSSWMLLCSYSILIFRIIGNASKSQNFSKTPPRARVKSDLPL